MGKNERIVYWLIILTSLLFLIFNLKEANLGRVYSSIALIFFLIIPGFLIFQTAKIKETNPFKIGIYSIALSISLYMLGGLFLSLISSQGLTTLKINIFLATLIISLSLINLRENRPIYLEMIKISKTEMLLLLVILLNGILGALFIKSRDNNLVSILTLVLILIFVFLKFNSQNENYELTLVILALTLLLMATLLSDNLLGFDINKEYQTFRFTFDNYDWDINNFKDNYNSCLSITILPTVVYHLTQFNDKFFMFKLGYSLIFSLVPLILFFLFLKFFNKKIAFLASLFIMTLYTFLNQMPGLARQEIAFMYFTLIVLLLFEEKNKQYLLLIFCISLVVSHYTTSLIALAILIPSFLFLRNKEKAELKRIGLVFILFSLVWYLLIAVTIGEDVTNLTDSFLSKITNNEFIQQELKSIPETTQSIGVNIKAGQVLEIINLNHSESNFEPKKGVIRSLELNPAVLYETLVALMNIVIRLFVVVGIFYIIKNRKKLEIKRLFILMILFAFLILITKTFFDVFSVEYNNERLYFQAMFLLAPIMIYGLFNFLKIFSKNEKLGLNLIVIFILLNLTIATGLLSKSLNQEYSSLLNKKYEGYNKKIYTFEGEFKAIEFLNKNEAQLVLGDVYSILRFEAFGDYIEDTGLNKDDAKRFRYLKLENLLGRGYIFLRKENLLEKALFMNPKKAIPLALFSENLLKMDKVYSNYESEILFISNED